MRECHNRRNALWEGKATRSLARFSSVYLLVARSNGCARGTYADRVRRKAERSGAEPPETRAPGERGKKRVLFRSNVSDVRPCVFVRARVCVYVCAHLGSGVASRKDHHDRANQNPVYP